MSKIAVVAVCLLSTISLAQSVCSTTSRSSNLVCLIPQLYGPGGLTLPNPFHKAHFDSDFEASFTPLNAAVGTELTLLPIASPASGFTFTFDPSLGVMTRSAESFGPILTERAETIGRHKIYVGFTFQHFGFSSIDGVSMKNLPATFTHLDTNPTNGQPVPPGGTPSPGVPAYELDYITTENRLDLKTNQYTGYLTFGLTNRVDVSIAIPVMNVRFGISSVANIVRRSSPSATFGYAHFFDPSCVATQQPPTATELACQAGSTRATFSNVGVATGIGDVVLRGKGTILKTEHLGLALGLDVRLPSGDERNFLGSGAVGVKPFLAASYRARVSPHVNVGYEWNGNSILAGNISTGAKSALPRQFFYSGGLDVGVSKRLTIAADLLGQRVLDANTVRTGPYVDITGTTVPNVPQINIVKKSFEIDDLSVGAKVAAIGKLLVSANVLIKLDDGGLRSKVVPLVGLSYAF